MVLAFAAVVEISTGVGLIFIPAIVAKLLLRAELDGTATILARCFGIALLALGMACWPGRARAEMWAPTSRAMLVYNAGIALYLAYLGAIEHVGGPLLWPAVILHAGVALGIGLTSPSDSR